MNRNKLFVLVSPLYLPHIGGMEQYVARMATSLGKRNYPIIIVTSCLPGESSVETQNKIIIIRLDSMFFFGTRFPIPWNVSQLYRLYKEYFVQKPHIVIHTRFFVLCGIAAIFAKLARVRPLVIEHGSGNIPFSSPIVKVLFHLYEYLIHLVVSSSYPIYAAVSSSSYQWLVDNKQQPAGIVKNAIHITKVLRKKRKAVIVFAGRLLPEKGVMSLIHGFLIFHKKYPNYRLKIAGEGECYEEIRHYSQQVPSIELLGSLSTKQIFSQFTQAKLFVYPSSYPDGLSTALLEAAVARLPIICSNTKPNKELISNSITGLLLRDLKPKTIALSLEKAVANYLQCEEMAERLYRKIETQYNWEHSIDELLRIVHE